jgi:hypothetical protein
MDDTVEIKDNGFSPYVARSIKIVNDRLKYGYSQGRKFKFVRGQMYKVSYLNPSRTQHKGAVGVYIGSRHGRDWCKAILECMGKKFQVDASALIPWEGEITKEHLKLISPVNKRVHLMINNQPACGCSTNRNVGLGTLRLEDFLDIPENSRCKSCNSKAKALENK